MSLGQDFNEEIHRHIINAGCFVAFVSVHYCNSDYCVRELACAVSHGRVIVPVGMDAEGVVGVVNEDCVGDHPELFFSSYIPPFAVSILGRTNR